MPGRRYAPRVLAAVLSVVAAALYTFGLALQQLGGRRSDDEPAGRLLTAVRIATRPKWLSGFALTIVGFVLHGAALSFGSLTLVQLLQTTQILFVVPIGARITGTGIVRRDWYGAALVVIGIAALLLAVRPSEDADAGTPDGWAITILAGVLVVAITFTIAHARVALRAPLLGLAAGFVFGIEGATLKIASDDLADGLSFAHLVGPAVWATLGLALVGVVIQNMALRAGRLSVALSTMTISTPVTSAVIGVALFGENLDVTTLTVAISVVAAVLAGVGVVVLSQSVAAASPPEPTPPVATVATGGTDRGS
jgi:drug/metabolite transporter (DMT)-like permease